MWFVGLIGLLVMVMMIAWIFYTLARDGIDAQMLTFESEPSQGWHYWESTYRNEALRYNAVPIVITTFVIGTLVWEAGRTIIRIYSCFINNDVGHIEQSASSPVIEDTEQIAGTDRHQHNKLEPTTLLPRRR